MNFFIITIVAIVIPIVISVILRIRLIKLEKRFSKLTSGLTTKNLELIVKEYIETLDRCNTDIETINNEFKVIRNETSHFYRKTGIVRFQAFKDTGGDQSFALSILDQNDNGFIISSLYGRDLSKIYVKEITKGKSENYKLTEEEKMSLIKALKS